MHFDYWKIPPGWESLLLRTAEHARTGYRQAAYSQDQRYRYLLKITWNPLLPPYMLTGLNPSTATEAVNDPTIVRCIQFGKDWSYGSLFMTNLSAFRATLPRDMLAAEDRIGPHNTLEALTSIAHYCGSRVVVAWGTHAAKLGDWPRDLCAGLQAAGVDLLAFGINQNGTPKHPLYVPAITKPVQFNFREA
jgi:hypothetical protein